MFSTNVFGLGAFDHGKFKCYEYVTSYELGHKLYFVGRQKGKVDTTDSEYIDILELENYITFFYGYASAMNNVFQTNLYNDLAHVAIAIELNNYCEANPSKMFVEAIISVLKKYKK